MSTTRHYRNVQSSFSHCSSTLKTTKIPFSRGLDFLKVWLFIQWSRRSNENSRTTDVHTNRRESHGVVSVGFKQMRVTNRQIVPRWKCTDGEGHRELSGGVKMFCILIWAVVTWALLYIKIHWVIHLTVCALCVMCYTSIKVFLKSKKKVRQQWDITFPCTIGECFVNV